MMKTSKNVPLARKALILCMRSNLEYFFVVCCCCFYKISSRSTRSECVKQFVHFVGTDLGPSCLRHQKSLLAGQDKKLLIWAATFDFQQCSILTSIDSDKLVQPPFKLWNSKWCSVSSLSVKEYSIIQLWSECAYGQADPRLCWSHIPHCWKSHVAAQLFYYQPQILSLFRDKPEDQKVLKHSPYRHKVTKM